MSFSVGIVIYDGFSLIDLVGPFEILARAANPDHQDQQLFDQYTVGRNKDLITCHGGIQILPQHIYPDAHVYNVLLVPGGPGSMDATKNLRLMNWFARAAKLAKVVAAVGTGTLVLAASRLLDDRTVAHTPELNELYPDIAIGGRSDVVRDGKIFTIGSSDYGINLGVAIISELVGKDMVNEVLER